MSVSSSTAKTGPLACNGSLTAFPSGAFRILAEDEVSVIQTNSLAEETTLTIGTHYTVVPTGGSYPADSYTINTVETYDAGFTITMIRNNAFVQGTSYGKQGPFDPQIHETDFDRAVLRDQEIKEVLDRCVKRDASDTSSVVDDEAYIAECEAYALRAEAAVGGYPTAEKYLSSYGTLAQAVSTIGATEVTLVIDQDDALTGNVTVPSTIALRRVNGYSIDTNSFTLTISLSQELPASMFSSFADDVSNLSVPNGASIVIDEDITLTSSLTIDKLIELNFLKGNIITLGAYNLTINGSVKAGLFKIFNDSGAGVVAGPLLVDEVYPQWWGALGDGINDDSVPIQSAIEAAARTWGVGGEWTGAIVKIVGGRYVIGSTLTIQNNAGVSLVGQGKTKSNLIAADPTMIVVDMSSNNNSRNFLHGLRIHGGSAASGVAVNIGTAGNQIDIRDCWIDTLAKGVQGAPTSDSYITDCTMEFISRPIILANSNDMTISCNTFVDCGPIALGGGSFEPLFDFDTCERIGMFDNRIIATSSMSNTPSGVVRVSSCNDFVYRGNINNAAMSYVAGAYMFVEDSDRVIVDGNVFGTSYNENLKIEDSTDVVVSSNTFMGSDQAAQMTLQLIGAIGFAIRGNTFQDNGGLYDLQIINGTSTTENGTVEGNVFDLGYNLTTLSGPIYFPPNIGGATRNYLTAAPGAGTWKRGDVVYHQQPSASGNMGWVCTTAGTPGTWKSWGTISA